MLIILPFLGDESGLSDIFDVFGDWFKKLILLLSCELLTTLNLSTKLMSFLGDSVILDSFFRSCVFSDFKTTNPSFNSELLINLY